MHYGEITVDMNLSNCGPIPLLNHSAVMEVQDLGQKEKWLSRRGSGEGEVKHDLRMLISFTYHRLLVAGTFSFAQGLDTLSILLLADHILIIREPRRNTTKNW